PSRLSSTCAYTTLFRSRLVYERRMALNVGGDYSYLSFDPNLFWFSGTPLPGQTPETLEQGMMDEIERVKSEPVPEEEVERAKNRSEEHTSERQSLAYLV